MVVVDYGYFLHEVVWNRNLTFGGVCADYVKYIDQQCGTTVMSAERARRCKTNISTDVMFDKTTVNTNPKRSSYQQQKTIDSTSHE
ncbi:hypothetical protein PR048_004426 [Dryococelus australis]|uniref:Uncharacterized protein n=1 Tax=Dryococelus australis TaxID=614101 RepID=A0ABQ9I5F6_9NEOP|nr:hypothetical protein PR048_004426 [Dryococelus australis]